MPTTQKAWRLHSYGGPETLKLDDVPIPTPGPNQVLVEVSKAGINPFDWKIREGYVKDHMPLQLPYTLGVDFSGTVVQLGTSSSSSRLKIGDRVMTMSTALGAFASNIVVDENILARIPTNLDDIDAATIPIPALSAWVALHTAGEPYAGMNVLIHGASGIVGAFAVQFAKAAGAKVFATASGKNREYVMGLGADVFVDYQGTQKFEDILVHDDVDLVLDFVLVGGSMNTTDRSWKVLKPGGDSAIVSLADPSILGKIPEGYRGFFPDVQPNVAVMEEVAMQLADGKIRSKVAHVFPRDELVKAMEISKAGGVTGRMIVDFKHA